MDISGANAITLNDVEKEQCAPKRILSHRQHPTPVELYLNSCVIVYPLVSVGNNYTVDPSSLPVPGGALTYYSMYSEQR